MLQESEPASQEASSNLHKEVDTTIEEINISSPLEIQKHSLPQIEEISHTEQHHNHFQAREKRKSSCGGRARARVRRDVAEVSERKCCVCCCLAKRELQHNNQVFSLCFRASPLYPRCLRYSLLLLAIFSDIAICALFFSLEEQEEESLLFWENLV